MIDKYKLEQWSLALAKGGQVNAKEIVDAWNDVFTKRGMPRRAYTTCVSCLKRLIGDILRYYKFQEQQTTEAETNEPIETETDIKPIETDKVEEKTEDKKVEKRGRKKRQLNY